MKISILSSEFCNIIFSTRTYVSSTAYRFSLHRIQSRLVSPEQRKIAEELSESPLLMDYQFEVLRKSFSNEIDTSTMLNLDNFNQSKIIHYLHLQGKYDEIEKFLSSINYTLESFALNSNMSPILTAIMPNLSIETGLSLISIR